MSVFTSADRSSFGQVIPLESKELDHRTEHKLRGFLEKKFSEEDTDDVSGGHHHERPKSIVTAVAAAIINYALMFGLCCAYGMIIFAADHHKQHRALGVKMTLASAFIMGSLLAGLSRIPVAIGGTDLNPVVFLGDFVTVMAREIAGSLGLEYPKSDYRRLDEGGALERLLGPSSGSTPEFCVGRHLETHRAACDEYQEQLRATTIFAVAVSSALLGVVYFCLGRFRLTRYVNFLPTSITEAFLSCIGYKVFKYALKFCNYNIKIFVPAACIGVPMYFLKAMHIGNPAVVMPACLLVPLGVFYAFLYATGSDITEARDQNLMFPEMYNIPFYAIWTDSLGKPDKINISAWMATFPDLGLMLIVCVLDCVLKISATENKMPCKVQTDYEIMLHGAGNALVVACGSPVGYMQLKFNVINYGVMGNVADRRAGWLYAGLCGASLISTIGHFNYLPRFFMGTMLFFAGAGFVAENLWGSRKYLSLAEWLEILLILGVFIWSGQLLPAVGVGIILCGISFIMKYAKVPAIAGRPMTGKDVATRERPKSLLVQKNLQHIASSWLMVVRLKGFVFFASAHAVTNFVRNRLESEEAQQLPAYRRLKFVIFDCELLDGMDASGAKTVLKLVKDCTALGVKIFWSSMTPEFVDELRIRSIISKDQDWFVDLNQAVRFVETHVLRYRMAQQETWVNLHSAFIRNEEFLKKRLAFEPFRHIFLMESARIGCPWRYCTSMPIMKYRTVLYEPGQMGGSLFLVHSGAVALFDTVPSGSEGDDEWTAPNAVYQHGWFLNREALIRSPSKNYAIAIEDGEVLCWTQEDWWRMTYDHPLMMLELLKAAMKQQGRDNERDSKSADNVHSGEMDDSEWLEFEESQDVDKHQNFLVRATTWSRASTTLRRTNTSTVSNRGLRHSRTKNVEERRRLSDHKANSDHTKVESARKHSVASSSIGEVYHSSQDQPGVPAVGASGCESQCNSLLSDNPRNSIGALQGRAILNLPEELQVCLRELQLAQALGRMGFYEPHPPDEELFLPRLPEPTLMDLEIAFNTFSVARQGTRVVEPGQVTSVLMYAGFFNRLVQDPPKPLDKVAFLEFGRQALLVKLSQTQRIVISNNFSKFTKDANGFVRPNDLATLFRSFLKIDICMNEVDSISRTWLADPTGQFDVQAFESIVSWFLRKHEHDWHLMCGFRDVMDVPPDRRVTEAKLSADLLAKKAGIPISEAEEMLWSADWLLNGQGGGLTIDFGGLMSVVLMCLRSTHSRLPPSPKLGDQDHLEEEQHHTMGSYELSDSQAQVCSQEVAMVCCKTDVIFNHTSQAWTAPNLVVKEEPVPTSCRAKLALLLDDPSSSHTAALLSTFLSSMILLSVLHMVLEPLVSGDDSEQSQKEKDIWFGMELFFTVLFTVEFLVRLCVANALHTTTLFGFLVTPRNVCDFVAIIPLYVETILKSAAFEALTLLRIVRLARLSRLARIARLSRRFPPAAPISVVLVVIWGIYLLKDM